MTKRIVTNEDIDEIFEDAVREGKGFRVADVFAPERIDALAAVMDMMGHHMTQKEIDDLKAKGRK